MDKISVYVLDTRKFSFGELLAFTNISESEASQFEKYKVLEVKKEKLISYYFKKKYVGETFLNEDGKPLSKDIYFNISGSKGVLVIALNKDHDVGVDIEVLRPQDKDLIKYVCSDEEFAFVKNEVDFTSIWTNKESLVKCLGIGIKNNIKGIPALPINGKKSYQGEIFYSRSIKFGESIISLTLKSDKEFDYDLIVEDVKHG